MSLSVGSQIGPYRLLALAGVGGMGEVYRARDERLARDVAIKFLRQNGTANDLARTRLKHEAKAVAKLQHPNICTLFDVGEHEGDPYLVLEYLEGKTLAAQLKAGPLSLPDAIRIGAEVAAGLDAAHRAGILHRDIKPANIFVSRTGAKLLDFGLVRTAASTTPEDATETTPITGEGVVVGTLAYMAPEQLRGAKVDERTDVFALGLVLYEMLTGQRAFAGEGMADLMAAVLREVPVRVAERRPEVDAGLDRLVMRCLEKDPEERWQTARDLAKELQWIGMRLGSGSAAAASGTYAKQASRRDWGRAALGGVGTLGLTGAALSWWKWPAREARGPVIRVPVYQPEGTPPVNVGLAVSPAGGEILVGGDSGGIIYSYSISNGRFTTLADKIQNTGPWVISPDGKSLLYQAARRLVRMDRESRLEQVLFENMKPAWVNWGKDGFLYWLQDNTRLVRLPEDGGKVEELGQVAGTNVFLQLLTERKDFLITEMVGNRFLTYRINPGGGKRQNLVEATTYALLVQEKYWIYGEGTTLLARRAEPGSLRPVGKPAVLANSFRFGAQTGFDCSESGVLAYFVGSKVLSEIALLDRTGRVIKTMAEPGELYSLRFSPKSNSVVFTNGEIDIRRTIGTYDWERGLASQVVSHPSDNGSTIWSPDGKWIAFVSNRKANRQVFRIAVGGLGEPELLLPEARPGMYCTDWSPDGKMIAVASSGSTLLLDVTTKQVSQPGLLANATGLRFSPDSRWVAYNKAIDGKTVAFVARYPDLQEQWQVTGPGAGNPVWRGDGRELFFVSGANVFGISTDLSGAVPRFGSPQKLFERKMVKIKNRDALDVSTDGQRFAVFQPREGREGPVLEVLVNWEQLLD